MPKTFNTTIATFADDTALLAVGNTLEESMVRLQQAVNNVTTWTKKWRIKLNETKSTYKLSNTQPATSALLNSTRHVQIEIPPRTSR